MTPMQELIQAAKQLRNAINPLLVELPDRSVVNGGNNTEFREKIRAIQANADAAIARAEKLEPDDWIRKSADELYGMVSRTVDVMPSKIVEIIAKHAPK